MAELLSAEPLAARLSLEHGVIISQPAIEDFQQDRHVGFSIAVHVHLDIEAWLHLAEPDLIR